MLVLQAQAKVPMLRDWEQLVEGYLTKAARAYAPSKLLAMHSAVPNMSHRMVFQSRMPSVQPDMDIDFGMSGYISPGSSSSSEGLSGQAQSRQASDIQRLLSKVLEEQQPALQLDVDLAVGKSGSSYGSNSHSSHDSSDDYRLGSSSGSASLSEQAQTLQRADTQKLLDQAAAWLGTTHELSPAEESLGKKLVSQRSRRAWSHVRRAVQSYEQLSGQSTPVNFVKHQQEQHLQQPVVQRPSTGHQQQQRQTAAQDVTDWQQDQLQHQPSVQGSPTRQQSQLQHQPSVQGAAARNQAAIAAHQARLESLRQKAQPGQGHGVGNGKRHVQLAAAQCADGPPPTAENPAELTVQRSTHSAARLQAQARLKPVLRVQLAADQHAQDPPLAAEDPAELTVQRSTISVARLQAQARLKPVRRLQSSAADALPRAQHAQAPAAEDPAELTVQRSTISAARLQAQARLKPVLRLHSSAADGTSRAQRAQGPPPATEDPTELTVQRSSVSAARLPAQARLKPVRRQHSSAANGTPRQLHMHGWSVPAPHTRPVSPSAAAATMPKETSPDQAAALSPLTAAVSTAQGMQVDSSLAPQPGMLSQLVGLTSKSSKQLPTPPGLSQLDQEGQALLGSRQRAAPSSADALFWESEQGLSQQLHFSGHAVGNESPGSVPLGMEVPNRYAPPLAMVCFWYAVWTAQSCPEQPHRFQW